MRSLLLTAAFLLVAFAGCLDEAAPEDARDADTDGLPGPGSVAGHPVFGYRTNDDLVASENATVPRPARDPATGAVVPPGVDAWMKPAYKPLPEPLSGMELLSRSEGAEGTQGIGVFGPLAVAGGNPLQVIDLTDVNNPHVVGELEDVPVRDADFILYPDGRLVVVTTGGGSQMFFVDITDAYEPELVGQLDTPHTNHNLAVVPGTPIVYNSPSNGNGEELAPTVNDPRSEGVAYTDIIDASDPSGPVIVQEWQNGYGCHDITFYMSPAEQKYRGYCAGIDALQIWDLQNATDPQVVNTWGWPALGQHDTGALSIATFAHLAMPNHDASILILGDETGGGGAPGCDVSIQTPTGQTVTGPIGNLWFYDITDEMDPVLRGSISPSAVDQRGSCTAHFGKVIEDTDHVVVGFYSAGVVLVDFTDPQNPTIKDRYEQPLPVPGQEGQGAGSIWDVWYHSGYLVTGDIQNGVDILTLT